MRAQVLVRIEDFYALGGQWRVEAWVTVDGDSCKVDIEEATGKLYGRSSWLNGDRFLERLSRIEQEQLEQRLGELACRQVLAQCPEGALQ